MYEKSKWTLIVKRGAKALAMSTPKALQSGGWALGERWHREFLPMHFTMGASERYGYERRQGTGQQAFLPSETHEILTNERGGKYYRYQWQGRWYTSHGIAGYMQRKLNKYRHQLPLVYTGRLREAVRGAVTLIAGERNVKIRMRGPQWLKGFLSFRGRRGTGPDLYRELTRIIPEEAMALARTLKDAVLKVYAKARDERAV